MEEDRVDQGNRSVDVSVGENEDEDSAEESVVA